MRSSQSFDIELEPPSLGFQVLVRLSQQGERWVAAVDWGAEQHHGVGATARAALVAALTPVGPRVTVILMADPAMFGASATLLAG